VTPAPRTPSKSKSKAKSKQASAATIPALDTPSPCPKESIPSANNTPSTPDGEQALTLSTSLQLLAKEDPSTLLIVRRINKLGFKAVRALKRHFSAYGAVERVLVAHSITRKKGDMQTHLRRRPSSLGFVQMVDAEAVIAALDGGSEQEINGANICVQKFERQNMQLQEADEQMQEAVTLDFDRFDTSVPSEDVAKVDASVPSEDMAKVDKEPSTPFYDAGFYTQYAGRVSSLKAETEAQFLPWARPRSNSSCSTVPSIVPSSVSSLPPSDPLPMSTEVPALTPGSDVDNSLYVESL
jgi:hypothetical protein